MNYANPFSDFAFGELLDTLLPDFVLAFTFFTALCYAVLGKRFGAQRPAVAMSGAIGVALAVGLVWWEQSRGWSIRNLGPIAVGFALILLAMVLYQAVKNVGGTWAGAGVATGASIFIAWVLGTEWAVNSEIVRTVAAVALVLGVIAFELDRHSLGSSSFSFRPGPGPRPRNGMPAWVGATAQDVHHNTDDLRDDRRVSKRLERKFKHARHEADHLYERPQDTGDVMLQLRRMLPAEGWLTERPRLREKVHHIREGELGGVAEIEQAFKHLPDEERTRMARQLAEHYRELRLNGKIEKLDSAVAGNEKRIIELTRQAEAHLANHDFRGLHDDLKAAQALQQGNTRLFKVIDHLEKQIAGVAQRLAHRNHEVSRE